MSVSGTLGSLLQGVSQQPPHIRNDGQVTEQINMVSDVVEGLISRPGAYLEGYNEIPECCIGWKNITVGGINYQVGHQDGMLVMLDNKGQNVTVNSAAGTQAQVGDDCQLYVYDHVIYVLNRDKVVAMQTAVTQDTSDVVTDVGLVTFLGGLFGHKYQIIVETASGTKYTGTYDAPDGTNAGDAAKTTSDYIADRVASSLNSDMGGAGTATSEGPVVAVTGISEIKMVALDGSGGDTVRSTTSIANDVTDLAPVAPHGTLVRVVGQASNTSDDYWLRFSVNDATVGGSFGSDGIWEEWFNPFEPSRLDATTMPLVLIRVSDTEFNLDFGEWQGRRVGDNNTNPEPGFVGSRIRDITGFQSRLVFLTPERVAMSRTNIATDFWNQSATANIASDPIDLLTTSEAEVSMQWLVPFDRDLVIFGDDTQFLIVGSEALTPENASIVQTTSFDMSSGAQPVSTGRTVMFPFLAGNYAGVKEFYSANSVDANEAISITQVQDKYMLGKINFMLSSTNFSYIICTTDHPDNKKAIFVYKYYWNGEEKVQSSWSRWDMPYEVRNMHFEDSSLKCLMFDPELDRYAQTSIDLEFPKDEATGYHVSLDLREDAIADANHQITVPNTTMEFVQGEGCAVPGQTVTPLTPVGTAGTAGSWTVTFNSDTVPEGATVIYGETYERAVWPTMPFVRDKNGKAIKNSKIVINDFNIYFEQSGDITSTMKSKYRAVDQVYTNDSIPIANDPNDPDGIGVRSGVLTCPWGEQSDWSELVISSTDARPMNIIDVEWVGQLLTRGRRL